MAAVDRNAAALGLPTRVLMEAAGGGIARMIDALSSGGDSIAILAGGGDNGGDALVSARYLSEHPVDTYLLTDPGNLDGATAENWDTLVVADAALQVISDSSGIPSIDADIVVDGLIGTGLRGRIREPICSAIEAINTSNSTVVSVDVPSGVDPDSGAVADIAVTADHVVTFHDMKPGLVDLDAEVTVVDIGIPTAAERFVGPGDRLVLDGRDAEAHKGDHGRILVIGGGPYTGAPALTGLAALRAGADLVTVATPTSAANAVAGYSPDLVVRPLDGGQLTPAHIDLLAVAIDRADVVAIGPGLGDAPETIEAATLAIDIAEETVVVDADAIEAVAGVSTDAELIVTPHAGEFESMGFERPTDWRAAETIVRDAALDLEATVVLKGRFDVISDGERTAVNRTGNPGMTVGGTGDVLTGVVGALAVSGTPIEAGAVGTWVTGRAGDRCLREFGVGFLASDVIEAIPMVGSPINR